VVSFVWRFFFPASLAHYLVAAQELTCSSSDVGVGSTEYRVHCKEISCTHSVFLSNVGTLRYFAAWFMKELGPSGGIAQQRRQGLLGSQRMDLDLAGIRVGRTVKDHNASRVIFMPACLYFL